MSFFSSTSTTTTNTNPSTIPPNNPPPPRHKAIAWDPKSPSTLLIPSTSTTFQTFLSHDGIGCNANETSALMQILNVRDDYYKSLTSSFYDEDDEEVENAKKRIELSKSYRRALQACLQEWEERLASSEETGEEEVESLELLKLMYAITHLSEIYLLPPPSFDGALNSGATSASSPGGVTANTVKYLRLHHMSSPFEEYSSEDVEAMLRSTQPEYYSSESQREEEGDTLYWSLLRKLTIRGNLDDVWSILSRHSSCRRCAAARQHSSSVAQRGGEYDYDVIKEDHDGFDILHALLLSAPLPGGRNDSHDDGLLSSDEDEENEEEEDEDVEEALEDMLMEGVPRSSYKLWESDNSSSSFSKEKKDVPTRFNPRLACSLHTNWIESIRAALSSSSYSPLAQLCKRIPKLYTHVLSIILGDVQGNIFDSWSEALCTELLYKRPLLRVEDVHVRTLRQMESFGKVAQGSFEELVLCVMRGNAGQIVVAMHDFGGGSGAALPATMTALLCNLLTEANQIQPSIPSSSSDDTDSFNIQTELLLSASHSILSSFSTTTSSDVGVTLATRLLLPHTTPSSKNDTEYLRITAQLASNISTFVPSNDASTKIVLKLCIPLIKRGSFEVLDSCESLTQCRYRLFHKEKRPRGIIYWLLRGMELHTLFPRICKQGVEGDKKGRKQRRYYGIVPLSSPSYRNFVLLCTASASHLLKALVDNTSVEDVAYYLDLAQQILEAVQQDDDDNDKGEENKNGGTTCSISTIVSKYREVKLLHCIVSIATSMMKEKDEDIAKYIIRCLEECVIPSTTTMVEEEKGDKGVVLTLAHPTMYDGLLCLAYSVLEGEEVVESCDPADDDGYDDEKEEESERKDTVAAFDVHGIHILMARLSQLIEWDHFDAKRLSPTEEEDENEREGGADDDVDMMDDDKKVEKKESDNAATTKLTYTVPQMRLSLCKGLGRAFVAENAIRKQKESSLMSEDVKEMNASFMALGREERTVELMLAPTM